VRNWAGNIEFGARRLLRPRSVPELQEAVASAERIRTLGTGHSFNRIADTTGELVTVRDIAGEVQVDGTTARVPAGMRYGELATALDERRMALHNLGSLPHISVAGACATATHGSGVGNQCLAGAVVGVDFVRADGELVQIKRGDESFEGCVVALGALGVVTHVTLAVEPSYELRQHVYLDAPLEAVLSRLDEIFAAGYSVSLFSAPERPKVVDQIWVKTRVAAAPDGVPGRPAAEPVHPLAGHAPCAATEQLGVPGPWHARLPHFRLEFTPSAGAEQQSEFLLAREHAADAIRAVHTLPLAGVLQVAEIRTIAADGFWLSPFFELDAVGVHFTWIDDDAAVHDALGAVERALAPYEPRPHWGKVFRTDAAAVRARYPRLSDFQALASEHDPDRKFGNDFLEAYVY
jgi:xylitol oxidase